MSLNKNINFINFIENNEDSSFGCSDILDRIGVILLCGGEGKRLSPLTQTRCKPAVSFGGRYKLIDIPISHAITSGLSRIFVIGQYLTHTLQNHIFGSCHYPRGNTEPLIHLLSPEGENPVCYKGTADAVRQNISYFEQFDLDYFLILSGDQLYNINFQEMIGYARKVDSDMLIAAQPIPEKDVSRMGILKIDESNGQVIDFFEKPESESVIESFKISEEMMSKFKFGRDASLFLGSMGIYLFKKESLFSLLTEDPRDDFGKHLIHSQINKKGLFVFLFDGYWADIGTIESYYEANLKLIRKRPEESGKGLCCYDNRGTIFSYHHNLPGAIINNSLISNSLICEGCVVDQASVSGSVLGVRTTIGENTRISDSVILGNEYYGGNVGISSDCVIEKSIVDENAFLGKGVQLINKQGFINFDSEDNNISVRDGIIVVPKGTILPDYYVF
ncbi:MAG: sugar phosphate nucleotidyltransferase [Victivallaceae bacterium]